MMHEFHAMKKEAKRMFARSSCFSKRLCANYTSKRFNSVGNNGDSSIVKRFWSWTTKERANWKESPTEALIICTIFGITGSSTLYFVRPVLKRIGFEGSMIEGPNSYRVASVLLISPMYASILLILGTIGGRHLFFAKMAHKIYSRFIPNNKIREKILCTPALLKKK